MLLLLLALPRGSLLGVSSCRNGLSTLTGSIWIGNYL